MNCACLPCINIRRPLISYFSSRLEGALYAELSTTFAPRVHDRHPLSPLGILVFAQKSRRTSSITALYQARREGNKQSSAVSN